MARPLRFRRSDTSWSRDRVVRELREPLDANLGATMRRPWFHLPEQYDAQRFDMDNGDTALFAWSGDRGWWLGNTETPSALWDTDKYGFSDVPEALSSWAQREFLAELLDEEPWFEPYEHLAWFFLPVLCSKDGRASTRAFFRDHAAGFPTSDRDSALAYLNSFLDTGILDPWRFMMAGKLGTSESLAVHRMAAVISEFVVAELLVSSGYDIEPEAAVSTGHSIDFKATGSGPGGLVEVTRPRPVRDRAATDPVGAVRDTVERKSDGQLDAHGGGVTLLVDCSSFEQSAWDRLRNAPPDIPHSPAALIRTEPSSGTEAIGTDGIPFTLDAAVVAQ